MLEPSLVVFWKQNHKKTFIKLKNYILFIVLQVLQACNDTKNSLLKSNTNIQKLQIIQETHVLLWFNES
jgi:hypothetical protein